MKKAAYIMIVAVALSARAEAVLVDADFKKGGWFACHTVLMERDVNRGWVSCYANKKHSWTYDAEQGRVVRESATTYSAKQQGFAQIFTAADLSGSDIVLEADYQVDAPSGAQIKIGLFGLNDLSEAKNFNLYRYRKESEPETATVILDHKKQYPAGRGTLALPLDPALLAGGFNYYVLKVHMHVTDVAEADQTLSFSRIEIQRSMHVPELETVLQLLAADAKPDAPAESSSSVEVAAVQETAPLPEVNPEPVPVQSDEIRAVVSVSPVQEEADPAVVAAPVQAAVLEIVKAPEPEKAEPAVVAAPAKAPVQETVKATVAVALKPVDPPAAVRSVREPAAAEPAPPFQTAQVRNPFWPAGYLPESWGRSGEDSSQADSGDANWDAPAALLRVSGTSRMGSRMVAIINNDLKNIGDLVEVEYSGRVYQWKVQNIQPDGRVNLERYAVRTDSAAGRTRGIQ